MINTDGRPTIAMRASEPLISRADVEGILEATGDPTEVGIETMLRCLTEEDFDRLLAWSNGWE